MRLFGHYLSSLFLLGILLNGCLLSGKAESDGSPSPTPEAGDSSPSPTPEADVAPLDDLSPDQRDSIKQTSESHEFQAEVSRLMDIIINSLYSQKEVFLRELISNGADALEKVRFLSVADANILKSKPELEIRVDYDKDAKTLSIQDSGVGMTKQDLINNLGTVAKSGTSNFLEAVAQGGEVNLIGQFGVGFYSAFLVADRVTVVSKNDADEQHVWESAADRSFSVAVDPRGNTLGRGTRITLHLKEDATEFLADAKLKSLLQKFNQFVTFPIYLRTEHSVKEKVPVEEPEESEEDVKVDDEDSEDKKKEKFKEITKTVHKWEQVNTQKAIWMRPKEDITEAEYLEFYKSLNRGARTDPLNYTHFSAEGEIEFKSILYIPGDSPHDAWQSYFNAKQDGVKLYVRRVLVADEVYELLPKWLNFVKGVVDSDDLPLKVDRESLSQSRVMKVIGKKLVGKFLELLKKMSKEDLELAAERKAEKSEGKESKKESTRFSTLWKNFAKNLKVGCVEDNANREKLVKLFRYHSSKTGEKESTTLDEYVARMPEHQKSIYYIAAENFDAAMASPHIQMFLKKEQEVLVLMEPLDEPCFSRLYNYDGKKLTSIEKVDAKLEQTDEEKKRQKKITKAYQPLCDFWTKQLKDRGSRVEVSNRLVEDPVVIVADQWGHSAFTERVVRAQTFGSKQELALSAKARILQVNPDHPLIKKMLAMANEDSSNPKLEELADTLFDWGLFASGFHVENPQPLVRKMFKLLQQDAGVAADEAIEAFVVPEDDLDDEPVEEENSEAEGIDPMTDPNFMEQLKNMERKMANEENGDQGVEIKLPSEEKAEKEEKEEKAEKEDAESRDEL